MLPPKLSDSQKKKKKKKQQHSVMKFDRSNKFDFVIIGK